MVLCTNEPEIKQLITHHQPQKTKNGSTERAITPRSVFDVLQLVTIAYCSWHYDITVLSQYEIHTLKVSVQFQCCEILELHSWHTLMLIYFSRATFSEMISWFFCLYTAQFNSLICRKPLSDEKKIYRQKDLEIIRVLHYEMVIIEMIFTWHRKGLHKIYLWLVCRLQ